MALTRVLIDGRALYDGNRFRGIGVYLRQLVDHLEPPPELEVAALVTDATQLPRGVVRRRVKRRLANRFAGMEHALKLPVDVARQDFDVFHNPSQDVPRSRRKPWVQTLHAVDEHASLRADQLRLLRRAPQLREAAAVIVPSEHARAGLVELLRLAPELVHVVPHGVNARFQPDPAVRDRDRPYILYVSEYGPWKGYPEAFEVAARLADAGLPHRLKVAGQLAPWVEPEVRRLLAAARRPDRVDLLGFIPHDDLIPVYQGASAAIVTSHMEGFGLPAAEAMATGLPLVAFSNTALPEVVGTGGCLVSDGDVEAMADALVTVLRDQSAWADMSQRALTRSRAFDWGECARAHVRIWLEVAAA